MYLYNVGNLLLNDLFGGKIALYLQYIYKFEISITLNFENLKI